jgi:AraC-like DNA-binding protein
MSDEGPSQGLGGQRALNEIARMLGFSGLSPFSRWFRNRFGQGASEWRAVSLRDTPLNSTFRGK